MSRGSTAASRANGCTCRRRGRDRFPLGRLHTILQGRPRYRRQGTLCPCRSYAAGRDAAVSSDHSQKKKAGPNWPGKLNREASRLGDVGPANMWAGPCIRKVPDLCCRGEARRNSSLLRRSITIRHMRLYRYIVYSLCRSRAMQLLHNHTLLQLCNITARRPGSCLGRTDCFDFTVLSRRLYRHRAAPSLTLCRIGHRLGDLAEPLPATPIARSSAATRRPP